MPDLRRSPRSLREMCVFSIAYPGTPSAQVKRKEAHKEGEEGRFKRPSDTPYSSSASQLPKGLCLIPRSY